MSKKLFTSSLAILLSITFIAPATFFIAPQRASAAAVSCIGGLLGVAGVRAVTTIAAVPVSNIPITSATGSTAGSTMGSCINEVILIPLARMIIRAILQNMTASVISWINGSNGTGQPSYVLNLSAHLQSVGDAVALPFINQIVTGFNSPFGSAISSALKTNYTQRTSLAGFFAANQDTLTKASPNVNAFLAGNWSQGGVAAWFSLTTESQNNPYTLYQVAQSQLASNVSQAQDNRRQDLLQSSGFLSWCGTTDATTQTRSQASFIESSGTAGGATSNGINPGDTCTNKDGTPGTVQTPGSVIHDYTKKAVVDSGFEQLISANDLDGAFTAIITTLLNQVLGTATGGLLGASRSSGSSPAFTTQLQNESSTGSDASQSAYQTVQTIIDNITTYMAAWTTIVAAANNAETNIISLVNTCTTNVNTAKAQLQLDPTNTVLQKFIDAATAQMNAAQLALASEVAPIVPQAKVAIDTASATRTFAFKVQSESLDAVTSRLGFDLTTLLRMSPSMVDITNAQQQSVRASGSQANPTGSLTISGSTIVDQMTLISTNAATLATTVCNPSSSLYAPSTTGP